MTLGDLKKIVADPSKLGIPVDQQKVMLLNKELINDLSLLKEIGVTANSILQITKKMSNSTKDVSRAVWS